MLSASSAHPRVPCDKVSCGLTSYRGWPPQQTIQQLAAERSEGGDFRTCSILSTMLFRSTALFPQLGMSGSSRIQKMPVVSSKSMTNSSHVTSWLCRPRLPRLSLLLLQASLLHHPPTSGQSATRKFRLIRLACIFDFLWLKRRTFPAFFRRAVYGTGLPSARV